MIIPTILIAVIFASGGISIVIPNLQQNDNDFIFHQLEPKVSASNEEANQKYESFAEEMTGDETGNPMYQNEQKLDGISKHNNYRGDMKIYTGDMEDVKYDDTAITNSETDDSSRYSKIPTQERKESENTEEIDDKQDKTNHLTHEENGSEEINIDSESSKETDGKISDYEDFEDHDKFTLPDKNDWYEKYGYMDYDDGNQFHRKFGKYGMYGSYDKLGEYSSYGGSYGCLELGHGEYC